MLRHTVLFVCLAAFLYQACRIFLPLRFITLASLITSISLLRLSFITSSMSACLSLCPVKQQTDRYPYPSFSFVTYYPDTDAIHQH